MARFTVTASVNFMLRPLSVLFNHPLGWNTSKTGSFRLPRKLCSLWSRQRTSSPQLRCKELVGLVLNAAWISKWDAVGNLDQVQLDFLLAMFSSFSMHRSFMYLLICLSVFEICFFSVSVKSFGVGRRRTTRYSWNPFLSSHLGEIVNGYSKLDHCWGWFLAELN